MIDNQYSNSTIVSDKIANILTLYWWNIHRLFPSLSHWRKILQLIAYFVAVMPVWNYVFLKIQYTNNFDFKNFALLWILYLWQILYSCSTEGCNRVRKNEVNAAGQDLLVITRNTQTVRAVDIHSGSEKYVFEKTLLSTAS